MSNDSLPTENIYGHVKRLNWIISHIDKEHSIIEFGCGTGYMISRPLAEMGYDIIGLDLDEKSVTLGQRTFQQVGLDPNKLKVLNIAKFGRSVDVIIASEVLEHIPKNDLTGTLQLIRNRLKPNGILLVTVPNGYGWFEMESFLWFKAGLGRLLEWLQIARMIRVLKSLILGRAIEYQHPSTLADSPHVQHFTFDTIKVLLRSGGFEIIDITGSVLFAGPFSNLLFTGVSPIMKLNCMLGGRFPRIAAAFYVACQSSQGQAPTLAAARLSDQA